MTAASEQFRKIVHIGKVFSPAAPIDKRDLFAGRIQQLARLIDVTNTRGQHAAIFGERGVGKTSLANIARELLSQTAVFDDAPCITVKVNCSTGDTFAAIWRKAIEQIEWDDSTERVTVGFRPAALKHRRSLVEHLPDSPLPHDICRLLESVGKAVFIFDEFDRIEDPQSTAMFADTIKEFSDYSIPATIVVVGVADSIDDLIKEHQSIDRALCQILMPRMTSEELTEIIMKALEQLDMQMDDEATTLIVLLSQGLPHYTHLLGKAACRGAVNTKRTRVTANDVRTGIDGALRDSQEHLQTAYQKATISPRKDTLFKQVLLAAALAPVDDLGFFASGDVRKPLTLIMGRPYDIPGYSQHLDKFSSPERGNVLEKAGTQRKFRFRFRNPLLQPYVIMRGLADNMLPGDALSMLQQKYRHDCAGSRGKRRQNST